MLVIVAPGQGSQTPGFLTPWLDEPACANRLEWLSTVAGLDLVHYGTEADAETIRDTAVAQPLLVGAGLIAYRTLFTHPADAAHAVSAVAGHSVGEITAAAIVRVISAEQAMVFVRERGRAMADASAVTPTGMTAVLGGDLTEVAATLEASGLTAANINGAGQVVAAGTLEQLAQLAEKPPEGARLRSLSVAGAFHTDHMAPAVERLRRMSAAIDTGEPRAHLLSNRDGHVVSDGRTALDRIVDQVARPVRWDLCQTTMEAMGVTGVLELPPAGTLTGLARRALSGVETFALKTPDQLDDARQFVDKHASPSSLAAAPPGTVVASPARGTFESEAITAGASLAPGTAVGTLTSAHESHEIRAMHGGTVLEWLVEDGIEVSPGQPLLRLHPEAVTA